jgi:CheY-like chemotaxis protein
MEDIRTASMDGTNKKQIEEMLKQADIHIRAGRYIAADELLQKVFAVQPANEAARTQQARIQFHTKQLSQRVGLEHDLYNEIVKYREIITKRNANHVNLLLSSAQQFLEQGSFKKASDQAKKAMALDPENVFAKALLQRLAELGAKGDETTSRELKFSSLLRELWRGGEPSKSQREVIAKLQQELKIPESRRNDMEREVRNTLYKDELHRIWLTGGLSAFTTKSVDELHKKYKIPRVDHSVIEAKLLSEVRKNRIRGNVLVVDSNEDNLLEISSRLRENYFAVISAGTMNEAMESIKAIHPDIIISEMKFEGALNGFDFYEFIRTTPSTKQIPFIFMSESIEKSTMIISKRLGVDEFITKPIDYEFLLAVISGKLFRFPTRQVRNN